MLFIQNHNAAADGSDLMSAKKQSVEEVKDNRIDKGYFDILVYFVNIISLLKVKVEFQSSGSVNGFLYYIERYFTKYLDVDVQQVANVTVCTFPGINAITKNLAEPTFVIMILSLWIMLYFVTTLILIIFKKKKVTLSRKFGQFRLKLIEGYIETMKYSYSGLAGVTFIYLTNVNTGGQLYWKYDSIG